MHHTEQWIWLPREQYAAEQRTRYSAMGEQSDPHYTVAELTRSYTFTQTVVKAQLRFSADTAFQLYCNETIVSTGPAAVGGDFIGNETARAQYYAFETELFPSTDTLHFYAKVQMSPVQLCDYSMGHGGFMLSAILTFADGTTQQIGSDESWLIRKNGAYKSSGVYDGRISPDAYVPAECTENIWHTTVAPIPVRTEYEIPLTGNILHVSAGEEREFVLPLDKIWAGFLSVQAETAGEVSVHIRCRELSENATDEESMIFTENATYRGFTLHSAGTLLVTVKNHGNTAAKITVRFIATHYPIAEETELTVSDSAIQQILDTCRHTLKICRQTHHLDSPRHCEPLACTGDYYIETLMTLFSFGDMRLAEFDLVRTAHLLERENGRMFHTTYSLIWVRMLYDVYMMTGSHTLLMQCEHALRLLLKRFETYLGDTGLIENPPDYMFIDWIYIDGITMHHPPKALGQTCLNLFYYQALHYAEKIFYALNHRDDAECCARQRKALQNSINARLYDAEKGIYFEGLNTPSDESTLGHWLPQNTDKRYYMKHANILAAYVGVCDDARARSLIDKIMRDEIAGDCQPYFLHYLFEAIYRLGLREQYTVPLVKRWEQPVRECPLGLVEGFFKPEPTYDFDHSHAWGGTPLYSLPNAMLGLTIDQPGMRAVTLSPSLLGFDHAKIECLTPAGKISCVMHKGEKPIITAPESIQVHLNL